LWTSFLEVGTARERGRDCLSNTSTFVSNDRSQCLHCVLPIMRCAFGAHLDVGLAERQTPCRFIETVRRFLGSFQGRWPSLRRRIRFKRCVHNLKGRVHNLKRCSQVVLDGVLEGLHVCACYYLYTQTHTCYLYTQTHTCLGFRV